jgi:DNA-binding NtrC family response regulator
MEALRKPASLPRAARPEAREAAIAERFALPAARSRWTELLPLAHATLPAPIAFERDGPWLLVRRRPPPGRPVRDGRVPRALAAPLLLQAAAALAFFQAHGFALTADDLGDAFWDRAEGTARLWLPRSPASVVSESASAPPAAVLGAFLDRLCRRGGRIADPEAADLARRLARPEAIGRRAEAAVADVYGSFPALAGPPAAEARRRTAGSAGEFRRGAAERAVLESGRAALEGLPARVFPADGSPLAAGSFLPLEPPAGSAAEACRRLRELADRDAASGHSAWIAVGIETWDPLSRRALDMAARSLPPEVALRALPVRAAAPRQSDEWRREIFVPCGTLAASLRFYERLAEETREDPERGAPLAEAALGSAGWAAFVSDPTGQAPFPEQPSVARRPRAAPGRAAAGGEAGVGDDLERLLADGAAPEALAAVELWRRRVPGRSDEAWFEVAARFSAAGVRMPAWLERVEAERLLAGGRPAESRALFELLAGNAGAEPEERRCSQLRAAEVSSRLEGPSEAGRRAARWLESFPDAPEGERVRALRLEAGGLARDGRHAPAHVRLDEADRVAAKLPAAERIENALARAAALSLEGRFDEEASIYERWRSAALASGDDALAARFVSQEALGLGDRRRFGQAAARLEEALAVLRDDPSERARISIDLAATLFHAGRPARCRELLDDAASLASVSGRRDLLRIARSNRIELDVASADWEAAGAIARELFEEASRDGDELWLLVALHHRSRIALGRGDLARAADDNARARALAAKLGDRLEIGELWLEEGDRLAYAADPEGARLAWQRAAADPPDRCDTERVAAERLAELSWKEAGPPESAREALSRGIAAGDYASAARAARWRALLGEGALPHGLASGAERLLRERGGGALADRVFGPAADSPIRVEAVPVESLRRLREAIASGLSGEDAVGVERLTGAGIRGLELLDADGRAVLRLGAPGGGGGVSRDLLAGASRYRLVLPPGTPEPLSAAAAMLAETLLFRAPAPAASAGGFAEGWRRRGVVTGDASMEEPWRRLERFAARRVTVLVRGESGSGKEAVARAVHALSPRASGSFVAVNVPAIPAALIESELFGHARGAFTGAERDRAGLLEEAARGTIFFDEIGDLALELQAKLLRALQEGEIRRLGENRPRAIDVRVVSATSRDLAQEVEAGRFREDLFYRLHVAVIALPPLRERGRDVVRLARHFLDAFGRDGGPGALRLSPEAAAALAAHSWPGNVRELQNAMAQAAALADGDGVIGPAHLPEAIRRARPRGRTESYRSRLDAHRRGMISDALERAGGNRSLAARDLGLSRQALRYLIRELNVAAPAPAPAPRGRT